MKTTLLLITVIVVTLSLPICALEKKFVGRYEFDTRFNRNVEKTVDKIKAQYGDISDSEVRDILQDISFASCSSDDNTLLIKRMRNMGYRVISAIERATRDSDADLRIRANWMLSYLVPIHEHRNATTVPIEEAMAWIFCRSILDNNKDAQKYAAIGLGQIVYERIPGSPIQQGAKEGVWLYEMFAADSVEHKKLLKDLKKLRIPKPDSWFIELIGEYEKKKATLDDSLQDNVGTAVSGVTETGK